MWFYVRNRHVHTLKEIPNIEYSPNSKTTYLNSNFPALQQCKDIIVFRLIFIIVNVFNFFFQTTMSMTGL